METVKVNNLDANESVFFARQLEHVKAKSYDKRYPDLKATRLIPVSGEAGEGATTITYTSFDRVGSCKIIANYADDLPRADVMGEEFTVKVYPIGGSYGYNFMEVKNSIKAGGTPLQQRKANAARASNEQKVDDIAWFGESNTSLLGLLNQPNVPAAVASTGATTGFIPWVGASNKNAEEIILDMNNAVTAIQENTLMVESPDSMLLPVAQYRHIATTQKSTASDTTILEYFMKNNKEITNIEPVNKLKDVTPLPSGDAGTKDVMIVYKRDIDKLSLEIPMDYQQLPVQERNLEYVIPTISSIGGVIVYYPLSINIIEGI